MNSVMRVVGYADQVLQVIKTRSIEQNVFFGEGIDMMDYNHPRLAYRVFWMSQIVSAITNNRSVAGALPFRRPVKELIQIP